MKKLSKTLLMSPAVSLVLPAVFFVSFNSAYASLVDTSQNQTFESRPQAAAVSKRPDPKVANTASGTRMENG